ncbi:MAG: CPBP family intramembrane metalloprotease [Sphingobacteriaceae bacterium]|nr:MAG: CPBP family intramembrane metalloprotease [Sphingobacteriaceae bacterium]
MPVFLKFVQEWMEKSEKSAEIMVTAMLKMNSVGDLIKNVLLIGLATAVVEEFLFRGCLQTIFIRWTKNTHAAIWITAILFSAFHMQFFGFLPRVMLGVLFGYMVAYSGSIWPAMWGHFINNSFAVIATYLYQHKTIKIDPESQHVFNYTVYIISLIILLFLLWIYRYIALSKKQTPHY